MIKAMGGLVYKNLMVLPALFLHHIFVLILKNFQPHPNKSIPAVSEKKSSSFFFCICRFFSISIHIYILLIYISQLTENKKKILIIDIIVCVLKIFCLFVCLFPVLYDRLLARLPSQILFEYIKR